MLHGTNEEDESYGDKDAESGDRTKESRKRPGFVDRRQSPTDEVTHRIGQEPDTHHRPDGAGRSQFGHGAQPDRAEAEFADRVEEVSEREPPGADAGGLRYGNQHDESQRDEQQAP